MQRSRLDVLIKEYEETDCTTVYLSKKYNITQPATWQICNKRPYYVRKILEKVGK